MKKIFLALLTLVACTALLTSCFKDKDFGTNVTEVRGVAFTQAVPLKPESEAADSIGHSFGVNALSTPQTLEDINISLEADQPAASDVTITLALNNALVPVRGYDVLPASAYTVPLTVKILKGQTHVKVPITFPNSAILDPNVIYAIGLSIVSVDNGITIASNRKNLIVSFAVKNKYDGLYEITGTMVDANNVYMGDYGDPAFPREYSLTTTGPNSVSWYDISWDYPTYIIITIAAGSPATTGITPNLVFDPVTDAVSSVINGATGAPMTLGAGSKFNDADHSIDLDWTSGRWHVTEHWEYLGPR